MHDPHEDVMAGLARAQEAQRAAESREPGNFTPEPLWATEGEIRAHRKIVEANFDFLVGCAVAGGCDFSEARAMTRAELIRWLDDHDPRD